MPLSSRVVGYYLEGEPKTITRRVRRIVQEALKKPPRGLQRATACRLIQTQQVARAVQQEVSLTGRLGMQKKRIPEERRQDRMAEFVETSESDEGGEEARPPAKKKQPYERQRWKFKQHIKPCARRLWLACS